MRRHATRKHLAIAAGIVAAAILCEPGALAQFNTSTVHTEITFTFAGATFTNSGAPAVLDFDYEFDGFPSHFFEFPLEYGVGDGTSSIAGTATLAGISYAYDDPPPDFDPFDYLTDDMVISHDTYGQSSTPGSNGSANLESGLYFYIYNYTSDGLSGDPEPLTFTFDYSYTFDMELVEGAPGGGEANGFFDVAAEASYDTGGSSQPDLVQEYYGGPASLNSIPGSGQITFEIPANNSYIELVIHTGTNSTTLVPVPEPSTLVLATLGLVVLLASQRQRRLA